MGRHAKYSEEVLKQAELRYPDEKSEELAADLKIPFSTLKWMAFTNGWRKTRKFKSDAGRESAKKQTEESRIMDEMKGGKRRAIYSGVLLIKGNRTVHIPK